jgi:hypothetical protein
MTDPADETADQAADAKPKNPLRGLLDFLEQRATDPGVRAIDQD